MRHSLLRAVCLVLVCSFGGVSGAGAQLTEATLNGTIVDPDGRGIPLATIEVVHTGTGAKRSATADATGVFTISSLPPGSYDVQSESPGFARVSRSGLRLSVGQTSSVTIQLPIADLQETVSVSAEAVTVATSREARLADSFENKQIQELPLPQRDVFALPKLAAGATMIPGAASSTKLSSSPVITVNGNRYRGNNYVLDGAMNTNPNNSGEPAIVPSLESVEEVQVQTLNFASEFGRGNGAVINITTKSGTNALHGRAWAFYRGDALRSKDYFATAKSPQQFNQFGANAGGPIVRNRTFFFGSYEGTRDEVSRPYAFQVETPEYRNYVNAVAPNSVAARLLNQYPAPTPLPGINGQAYLDQRTLATPLGVIPAIGRAQVFVDDHVRFDQILTRVDHQLTDADRIAVRWIAEWQRDNGGTSSSPATLGRAMRGFRGPFEGTFSNLNVGHMRVFKAAVNDARVALQITDTTRGAEEALVPTISITGITAPFGDVFLQRTRLQTLEFRDILTLQRGRHSLRFGAELRRINKDLSIGVPTTGSFSFSNLTNFAADTPFQQSLTVNPATGEPTAFPRYFTLYESGVFVQDQWTLSPRLSLSLGLRHDYFGTVTERDGLLSSVVLGTGATFAEQVATARVGRVERLYRPERTNFSPRVGLAWDLFGTGRSSIRTGYSRAYQPHHGQSIAGARALPPDALQGVIQPSTNIGTRILYDIPVPLNPEFARGLNEQGGVISRPGEPRIRTTGFVVNPTIKTQYTESWFVNHQQRLGQSWLLETGYVGTRGVDLERIDDVNRFTGDLLDGREDRLNPNFSVLLFVTNGVRSRYDAFTVDLKREFRGGLSLQTNYRYSRWLDTSSDTSTGQFQDNSEPGKGAQDIACLDCEWGRSLFDIPHRYTATALWVPYEAGGNGFLHYLARDWQLSGIFTAQSGRPFSVWNGANFASGGDFNADGGGGAVGGGFYDRPNAPEPGAVKESFSNDDFLNGLFDASVFPRPAPGTNGTLGRNTFRGPRYMTLDLSVARTFAVARERHLQLRFDIYNALNTLNLFLPNADLAVSNFGKSTQAFDPRVMQVGLRFMF